VGEWYVDGQFVQDVGYTYILHNVTAAHTVHVVFFLLEFMGPVKTFGSWTTGLTHAMEPGYNYNRALIFIAHGELASEMNLVSVTYGGQAMTKIIDRNYYGYTGNNYTTAFILNEAGVAAATDGTFVPTWNPSTSVVGYSSVFLSNVDQTTPVGAYASYGGDSQTVTTSALDTGYGDMVVVAATCGMPGSYYTLNNGFIEETEQTMNDTAAGVTGYKSATGASETPSATFNAWVNRQVIMIRD
jgi:hypothetical protein